MKKSLDGLIKIFHMVPPQQKKVLLGQMMELTGYQNYIPASACNRDFRKGGMMIFFLENFLRNENPTDFDTQTAIMIVKGILKIVINNTKLIPESVDVAVSAAFQKLSETASVFQSVLKWIRVYLKKQPNQSKMMDAIIFATGSGTIVSNPSTFEGIIRNEAIASSKNIASMFPDYNRVIRPETFQWVVEMNRLITAFINSNSPQESKE